MLPLEIRNNINDDDGSREDGVLQLYHLMREAPENTSLLARRTLEYLSQNDRSESVSASALRALGDLQEFVIDRDLLRFHLSRTDPGLHFPNFESIAAGEFVIGCDKPAVPSCESPEHKSWLPEFGLATTPITNLQYMLFVLEAGYKVPFHWRDSSRLADRLFHPVVNVTWYDAMRYCHWLTNRLSHRGTVPIAPTFRLPSEAEWEKAARGPYGLKYPWGNEFVAENCNAGEFRASGTTDVHRYSHAKSTYGCLDLVGNVWEWTLSLWGTSIHRCDFTYPYRADDGRENLEADERYLRVIRGGGYYYGIDCVTGYTRNHCRPTMCHAAGGFRPAMTFL